MFYWPERGGADECVDDDDSASYRKVDDDDSASYSEVDEDDSVSYSEVNDDDSASYTITYREVTFGRTGQNNFPGLSFASTPS